MNSVAIHNFWRGIRWALNFTPAISIADLPKVTDELIDRLLVGNHTWLSAKLADTTEFFSEYETSFQFLPKAEFESMTEAVNALWSVAVKLRPHGLASDEQRGRALPHFKAIIRLLGFDRYADPDAFIFGKTLERKLTPAWPHHLDHMRFQTGLDSTGDPALWVWVYVTETGDYDDARFLARANEIEDVLKPIARSVAPEGRVYLHFRTTSDLPEAQGVAA